MTNTINIINDILLEIELLVVKCDIYLLKIYVNDKVGEQRFFLLLMDNNEYFIDFNFPELFLYKKIYI